MNFGATAEITKFDLPPIPRFLCAYVGDEWVIVARDTEACKKHFAERLEWLQSSKRPHAIVTVNPAPQNDAGELQQLRSELDAARNRLRETAQILASAIGAIGPENAEELAKRAAHKIELLRLFARATADYPCEEVASAARRVMERVEKC